MGDSGAEDAEASEPVADAVAVALDVAEEDDVADDVAVEVAVPVAVAVDVAVCEGGVAPKERVGVVDGEAVIEGESDGVLEPAVAAEVPASARISAAVSARA